MIDDYDEKANPLFIHFEHEAYKARLLQRGIWPTDNEKLELETLFEDRRKQMQN